MYKKEMSLMEIEEFKKKEGYKVLYVLRQPYQAEKIIKDGNNIKGFVCGKKVWEFPNISNLDDFKLEEGQSWDVEIDEIETLKQEKEILAKSVYDLTTIVELILTGGIAE